MNKQKVIGLIIGVISFIAVIAGITTAYLAWSSQNINKQVSSKCFNVLYEKGTDLVGAITPSYNYTGGLSTTVKMNVDVKCNINAKGRLYLNTEESTSSNLFREGLLNYTVVRSGVVSGATVLAEGDITESGEIAIDLGRLASSEEAFTRYDVYVWLDYNLVENSDINSVYYGSISAEAVQSDGEFITGEIGEVATQYITNLYLNNKNKIVKNGAEGSEIEYQYAENVNLMNDRLGGTTADYDAGNIRYYGANPNNYVDIGDRDSSGKVIPYRIIGLFKDVELSDGTKKDLIKVIRNDSIGDYSWDNKPDGIGSSVDDSGSNDWTDARLMMLLNPWYDKYSTTNPFRDISGNIIYGYEGSLWWNSKSGTCYACNVIGNCEPDEIKSCDFTSAGLSENAKNKIETVVWNLGGFAHQPSWYSNTIYDAERGTTVYSGRPTEWTGKVALMYTSDYGYATDFNSCSQTLYNYDNSSNSYACRSNDWLYNGAYQWLLAPFSSNSNNARFVGSRGYVDYGCYVDIANGVRPVFYLNSELDIESGEGTKDRPYVLVDPKTTNQTENM